MLRVKNNDIYFARGESVALNFEVVRNDGVPYILPKIDNGGFENVLDRNDYVSAVFTVRSGQYSDIVIQKIMNLEGTVMYSGETDYSQYGYAKFSSQDVKETGSTSADLTTVTNDINAGNYYVYHSVSEGNDIYQVGIKDESGVISIAPYTFSLTLVLTFDDTADMSAAEYVYDLIIYAGKLKNPEVLEDNNNEFPYSDVLWKFEVVSPHKLTLEDTNNA